MQVIKQTKPNESEKREVKTALCLLLMSWLPHSYPLAYLAILIVAAVVAAAIAVVAVVAVVDDVDVAGFFLLLLLLLLLLLCLGLTISTMDESQSWC